ncbi:unnamed protein product [Trifolium pratense]|uniref:Uncharacterized protein n=1 Tax=Trifolium pratense TaxID=57577 RepID=A0ACB0M0A6_TRIPR|nr:unnamed protein product [Trifolium pratense]
MKKALNIQQNHGQRRNRNSQSLHHSVKTIPWIMECDPKAERIKPAVVVIGNRCKSLFQLEVDKCSMGLSPSGSFCYKLHCLYLILATRNYWVYHLVPVLFNDTIRANIAYGKGDVSEAEIIAAA